MKIPVSLTIAGSDSGGGAGIQADLKTFSALGTFGCSVITAVTAQNTTGVYGIHEIPLDIIESQIDAVLNDLNPNVIKTGMLASIEVIKLISEKIKSSKTKHIVVDPVMIAKGGDKLIQDNAVGHLISELLPLSTVVTPNIPEAQDLTGIDPESDPDGALDALAGLGPKSIFLKGGHLSGDQVIDRLRLETGETLSYENPRITSVHTHGTGCTLASAVATGLAQGLGMTESVVRARAYVLEAIRTAPGLGHGHGPLNHGHTVKEF